MSSSASIAAKLKKSEKADKEAEKVNDKFKKEK